MILPHIPLGAAGLSPRDVIPKISLSLCSVVLVPEIGAKDGQISSGAAGVPSRDAGCGLLTVSFPQKLESSDRNKSKRCDGLVNGILTISNWDTGDHG